MQPVLLFAFTLFLSASLMFIVELMVGKLVLPYLGGTPAVWNTCMVFWQALLLAGYYYAHVLSRKLPLARQIKIHAAVLLIPLLPLLIFRLDIGGVVGWFPPPGEANPIPWLLAVLMLTIGLPFFAISTTASLLQRWYSETDFPGASDPYFLYGASNVGSMLALFSYPIVIEPLGKHEWFSPAIQSLLWIAGYAALTGLIIYCGFRARLAGENKELNKGLPLQTAAEVAKQLALVEEGKQHMVVGGLWCLGGTGVTLMTYQFAGPGGTYVFAWGAILYGVIKFFRGLSHVGGPSTPVLPPAKELEPAVLAVEDLEGTGGTHEGLEMPETYRHMSTEELSKLLEPKSVPEAEVPSPLRKLRWVALAFVPSSLMLGVTSHITTDIAAIPLIWMLPLAIYLLSFILVFSRLPIAVHRLMVVLLMPITLLVICAPFSEGFELPTWYLIAIAAVLAGVLLGRLPQIFGRLSAGSMPANTDVFVFLLLTIWVGWMVVLSKGADKSILRLAEVSLFEHTWQIILLHLVGLFVVAMVCHGEMARTRPAAQHLTEFFLLMSLGGVLGGMFNALVAPNVFNSIVEYPLMAVAACLLMPSFGFDNSKRWQEVLDLGWTVVVVVFGASVTLILLARTYVPFANLARPLVSFGEDYLPEPMSSAAASLRGRLAKTDKAAIFEKRNFFGYFSINKYEYPGEADYFYGLINFKRDEIFHSMTHGTTTHGMQNLADGKRDQPLTYFHRTGPIGQLFDAMYARDKPLNVAVLGVGTGTLAAYMKPGWSLNLYEIDPAVVKVARDPKYFTYIEDCARRGVKVDVIMGDGRLKISEAPDASFDMLFMDAFTSDAVPVHLLTREAFELYKRKLKPDGVLVVNIANRYLDFDPVIANLAKATDLHARVAYGSSKRSIDRYATHWVVLAKDVKDFGPLLQARDDDGNLSFFEIPAKPEDVRKVGVWTDGYSNLWSVFRW